MGWFDKKVDDKGQSKSEADLLVERLTAGFETKLQEAIKPISETVAALQTEWNGLKTSANGEADEEERRRLEEVNKNKTPEELAAEERRKLVAITIATNARVTEGEIIGELSAQGLGEFVPKVREYLAGTPIERKAQADYPTYCRNIVDMVIGKAARSNGLRFDGTGKKFFLEDSAAGANGEQHEFLASDMSWQDPKSGKVMTASEQLKKLGIKPEEFAESVKNGVV